MYEIHFRRSIDSVKEYSFIARVYTLEEARDRREVSGDLVVHANTHKIVQSQEWLWDWERQDSNCHAQRAIRLGK